MIKKIKSFLFILFFIFTLILQVQEIQAKANLKTNSKTDLSEGKQEEKPCSPTKEVIVTLTKETSEEEGIQLIAKVLYKNVPVKNAVVDFSVPRLFGTLSLGEMKTNDLGISAIPFPLDTPGDAKTGVLNIKAKVVRSEEYFGETSNVFDGGAKLIPEEDPFPRAIWSPKTDMLLLLVIPILIGCVWSVYIFSVVQLIKIYKLRNTIK